MVTLITILLVISSSPVDLNRGTILSPSEQATFCRNVIANPLFSPTAFLAPTGIKKERPVNMETDDSLNFSLLGDYNLAGNYLNMSGWQVKPLGDYILFSSGGGFYVFTRDSLRKVQEISGPGYIWDFEVQGNYVFSASGDKGLVVFDLSSLTGNRVVAQVDIPYEDPDYNEIFGWGATGIDLIDTIALVTVRIGGLYVFSISDPRNPRLIGSNTQETWLMDVHIEDTLAFVTQYNRDLNDAFIVYSIANPANPMIIAQVASLSHGMRFAIRDTIAYIPRRYAGTTAINIANPANPTVLGTLELLDAQNVTLYPSGETLYAFIANLDNLVVADFTDPTNPHEVTTVNVRSTADYIDGHRLYHQGLAGAVLYDITYPYNPQLDTFYVYLGNPYYLQIEGDYAYIYDSYGCLRILHISQPDDITEISYYDRFLDSIPSGSWLADIGGMVVKDGYAYLIVRGYPWFCYLAIVKISDPHNPDWVGTKMWREYAGGNQPFVEDSLAYVPTALSGETYLRIIDIGNPSQIEDIGELYWSTWAALEVTKQDSLLFLAGGYDPWAPSPTTNDLGIASVARPALPRLITEFTTPNQCRGVDRFRNSQHLALADYDAGVHIFDFSDLGNLRITGTVDFNGYVEDVHIGKDMVFCGADDEFAGIDARSRNNPQLYGYYRLMPIFSLKHSVVTDVWSKGDSIGACISTGGLFLFRTGYVGITENRNNPETKHFATITNGKLDLAFWGSRPGAKVELLDATGRLVKPLTLQENDISHLSPGVYFIRFEENRRNKFRRITLVR